MTVIPSLVPWSSQPRIAFSMSVSPSKFSFSISPTAPKNAVLPTIVPNGLVALSPCIKYNDSLSMLCTDRNPSAAAKAIAYIALDGSGFAMDAEQSRKILVCICLSSVNNLRKYFSKRLYRFQSIRRMSSPNIYSRKSANSTVCP